MAVLVFLFFVGATIILSLAALVLRYCESQYRKGNVNKLHRIK